MPMASERSRSLAMTEYFRGTPRDLLAGRSFQRLEANIHGINIKLMKCTGLREARKMITLARALGMQVMLGSLVK